jgi:hypothetical protein
LAAFPVNTKSSGCGFAVGTGFKPVTGLAWLLFFVSLVFDFDVKKYFRPKAGMIQILSEMIRKPKKQF